MPAEWPEATVGDIAAPARNALVGGPFGSNLVSRDYVDRGVPVIRGQNMGDRWVAGDFAYVTPAKAASLEANAARPGDIVFTQRGTLGQVSLVPEEPFERYLLSQSQMKLTVDPEKADPHFFYYVFRSPGQQDYIRQHAIQTGVPHTNLGILRDTPVPLPSVLEQRAIAHILGTLDDKIELDRRMNETLEGAARSLFEAWFVDFGPVRAKVEGEDPGLPKHLADLFPDSFEDSELGKIPNGWTLASLGDQTLVLSGGTPSRDNASLWGGPIPWISPKVMTAIHADHADEYVAPEAIGNGTRLAPVGSTLVMVRGMGLHEKVRVSQVRREVAFNQDVKALVPVRIQSSLLLCALLHAQDNLLGRVESSGHGTGRLPSDILLAYPVTMPSLASQKTLAGAFDSVNDRIAASRTEARLLARIRDALLPKLISGEIRVKDAERFVERVL